MAAADADAEAIFDDLYLRAGKSTVIKYREKLRRLYEHLADFPDSGAPRAQIGKDIRIGIIHPYIVIYRFTQSDNTVRILRILYGRRKINKNVFTV